MSLPRSSAAALNTQLAILDALPAHFAVLDRHGVVVAVNEAMSRTAG